MTIGWKPENQQVIAQTIQAGLIHNPEEALDLAVAILRARLKDLGKVRAATPEDRVRAFEDSSPGSSQA
jgi:hypothetical protein